MELPVRSERPQIRVPGADSSTHVSLLGGRSFTALSHFSDERGAVYVEFLIAFFPLFLMFLAICQLSLLGAADVVVRHAAYSGVRSAIVVLDDQMDHFDQAPRGDLSAGDPSRIRDIDSVASKLGIQIKHPASAVKSTPNASSGSFVFGEALMSQTASMIASTVADPTSSQRGARMVPIRTAAQLPLIPLAPNESLRQNASETVAKALASTNEGQLVYALEYVKAATVVTVHGAPNTDALIDTPVARDASVTVKVRFLFQCNVPMVRNLMCRSLAQITSTTIGHFFKSKGIEPLVNVDARFKVLSAEATLPNQGASYAFPGEG
jgi:hypothetical protein